MHPGASKTYAQTVNASEAMYDEATETEEATDDYAQADNNEEPSGDNTQNIPENKRKIIQTADYRIEVKEVSESTKKVEALLAQHQAYLSNMSLNNSYYERTNNLTIRVPQQHFKALLEMISQEAIFTNYQRISAKDVTEEYVDIESRLKTKKEVRDRYVDILRNKAKTVEDVLNAEDKIRVLQEEIEAKEGRLRYLRSQVGHSTINLTMYQKIEVQSPPVVQQNKFFKQVKRGFKNGWNFLLSILLFLINIWPLLIIGGLIYWRREAISKRFRRKKVGKID